MTDSHTPEASTPDEEDLTVTADTPDNHSAVDPVEDLGADATGEGKRAARLRAQQAEAERDALQARVEALSRIEVERVIEKEGGRFGSYMHNPSDLWAIGGATLSDLTDENGVPDPEKIKSAVDHLREERRYLFRADAGDILRAVLSAHTPSDPSSASGGEAWGKALRQARHGA